MFHNLLADSLVALMIISSDDVMRAPSHLELCVESLPAGTRDIPCVRLASIGLLNRQKRAKSFFLFSGSR